MSDMTLREFSRLNVERAVQWHQGGLEEWSPAEWGNALAGECGELCNVLKKILRYDRGIQQYAVDNPHGDVREHLLRAAAEEIADTYAYLDLIAARLGLDLQSCVVRKFNAVSDRENFPQKFPDEYDDGIPLISTNHSPGDIERAVSAFTGQPVGVEDPEDG